MVGPNLEVFVNGVPDTVETNGTKLDRAQVFALPEIEYIGSAGQGGEEDDRERDGGGVVAGAEEVSGGASAVQGDPDSSDAAGEYPDRTPSAEGLTQHPFQIATSPSKDTVTSGRSRHFVSSTTCSICIDEFVPGERLRLLRCDHAFHTECILPWLTERQGCCPMCKVPVLPDELQRSRVRRRESRRSSQPSRNAGGGRDGGRREGPGGGGLFRNLRGGGSSRRHQPRSMPTVAAAAVSTEMEEDSDATTSPSPEGSPVVIGVRLVSELEGDLEAPRPAGVVTPEGSPLSDSRALVRISTLVEGEEDLASPERDLEAQATMPPSPPARVVTPEGSPSSDPGNTLVPSGTEGGYGSGEGDDGEDLTVSEMEDGALDRNNENSSGGDAFAVTGDNATDENDDDGVPDNSSEQPGGVRRVSADVGEF